MKKLFLIIAVTVLLLSACSEAVSVPVMTATPAETSTPEQSPTPAASPTPDYTKPYAVSSPDSAEFFFPLPEQEWEWFLAYCGGCFPSGVGPDERTWTVYLDLGGQYYLLIIECSSDSSKATQKGSTVEMLAECKSEIVQQVGDSLKSIDSSQLTFSYVNGGLTIVLAESSLTQALYELKPESLEFRSRLVSDNSDLQDRKYEKNRFDVSVTYK